jgi:YfiH family protein
LPNQPLAIFTADCVPVFLIAEQAGVVGLLHAGWRGVRGHILARAVRQMRRRWHVSPPAIRAWAGPSIGPCCFEVQWDTARYFPSTRRRSKGAWRVDLVGELHHQAKRLGIRWSRKNPSQGCTMHGSRYYSYRRDKTDKRQVSVIMIQERP